MSHDATALALLASLALAGSGTAQRPDRLHLRDFHMQSAILAAGNGEAISGADYERDGWIPVRVPSTVLRGLVAHGVYPDPYVGMNNMRIPDASDLFNLRYDLARFSHLPGGENPWSEPWWYRTVLEVPALPPGTRAWLNLEGINYRADVWLNGVRVAHAGRVVGMFEAFTIPVTDELVAGRNVLAVRVHPLDYPGLPGEPQLAVFGPFGLNGGETGDIGKNVTMQASVGWDWIPAVRDRNMGIWQDVFLSFTGPVDLRFPHVVTDLPLPDTTSVRLTVSAELWNAADEAVPGTLEVDVRRGDDVVLAVRHPVTLGPGRDTVVTLEPGAYPELVVEDPALWWPHTLGEARLYDLELRFTTAGGPSDREALRFGVREVGSEVTEVDGWLRRDFSVNGRRIEVRGGAWVPDMMLARDRQRILDELRLFRHAGFDLVRIWGGGVTPPSSFFEIADSLGLLVWHDFWITGDVQGTWDKGTRDWPLEGAVFIANAVSTAKRLRNHPSLLVWTAGNEGYPRRELYDVLRNDVAARIDGTRPFLPTSGYANPDPSWGLSWPDDRETGAYSGGPYHWVEPAEYFRLAAAGRDWLFKDEVGLPSVPPLASLARFIPDLDPASTTLSDTWGYHDAAEGNGRFSLYDRALRERYGEPADMASYAWKAQLLNAESYRAIFEAVNQELERTAGVVLWKTNAAWPSVVWQVYDWYLRPNAGYYAAKRACRPLHVQLHPLTDTVTGVNMTTTPAELTVRVQLFDGDGRPVGEVAREVTLAPGRSTDIVSLDEVPGWDPEALRFVRLALERDAETAADNLYWLAPDGDFTALDDLPVVELEASARMETSSGPDGSTRPDGSMPPEVSHQRDDTGPPHDPDRLRVRLTLTNPGDRLAFFVQPVLTRGPAGEEVLPTFWSDAYVSIAPGETRTLTGEVDAFRLEGAVPHVRIEGWNVEVVEVEVERSRR